MIDYIIRIYEFHGFAGSVWLVLLMAWTAYAITKWGR